MGPVAPKKKNSFAPGVFVAVVPFLVGSGTSSQGNVAHAVFQVRKVIFWGNMGKHTKKEAICEGNDEHWWNRGIRGSHQFFGVSGDCIFTYIYLQNWVIFGVNVGKYPSTMEHLVIVSLHNDAADSWGCDEENDWTIKAPRPRLETVTVTQKELTWQRRLVKHGLPKSKNRVV